MIRCRCALRGGVALAATYDEDRARADDHRGAGVEVADGVAEGCAVGVRVGFGFGVPGCSLWSAALLIVSGSYEPDSRVQSSLEST